MLFIGKEYDHQEVNPNNPCQWCNIHDKTAKANQRWSIRSGISCNDDNPCTRNDHCSNGRCTGSLYSCRKFIPKTSCIESFQCVGDGTCKYIFKKKGTICRPAVDSCDQSERYGSVQVLNYPHDNAFSKQSFITNLIISMTKLLQSDSEGVYNHFRNCMVYKLFKNDG